MAVDAMRSLLSSRSGSTCAGPTSAPATAVAPSSGYTFTELASTAPGTEVAAALAALGLHPHRPAPLQAGAAVGAGRRPRAAQAAATGRRPDVAAVAAIALETPDPDGAAARAEACSRRSCPATGARTRPTSRAVAAPDGTSVFFCPPARGLAGRLPAHRRARPAGRGLHAIDHVALTQPFDYFDEAALFYRSVLGCEPPRRRVRGALRADAQPRRQRTRSAPSGSRFRVLLRRGERRPAAAPQHIAFAPTTSSPPPRALRAAGAPLLAVPANYHDDLAARLDLDPGRCWPRCASAGSSSTRTRTGATCTVHRGARPRVFFEVVSASAATTATAR